MAAVFMYTTSYCPFCHRAKALLRSKGVAYEEIDVEHDPARPQLGELEVRGPRHVEVEVVGAAVALQARRAGDVELEHDAWVEGEGQAEPRRTAEALGDAACRHRASSDRDEVDDRH